VGCLATPADTGAFGHQQRHNPNRRADGLAHRASSFGLLGAAHGFFNRKADYGAAGQASSPLPIQPLHLLRREQN
jgi:hypothetical protein